jgi:hypothetical protein
MSDGGLAPTGRGRQQPLPAATTAIAQTNTGAFDSGTTRLSRHLPDDGDGDVPITQVTLYNAESCRIEPWSR